MCIVSVFDPEFSFQIPLISPLNLILNSVKLESCFAGSIIWVLTWHPLNKRLGGLQIISQTEASCLDRGFFSRVIASEKGMPQGWVLGPLLFTIYMNHLGQNIPNSAFHFDTDDIFCTAPTPTAAFRHFQLAFDGVQEQLCHLHLVLNADKTKCMRFTASETVGSALSENVLTRNGQQIQLVFLLLR